MKNILVAIDFSPCSLHALEYAIYFSNKTHANIKMIWVKKQLSSYIPFTKEQTKEERMVLVVKEFEKLIHKYQPGCKGKLSYVIREGKVHEQIAEVADGERMDLVIAGTHGISGFDEFWVGSNAFRIISYTKTPVITIRESFDFSRGINTILLPIDSSTETRQKVPFTARIARIFGSTVEIVSLFPSKDADINTKIRLYAQQTEKFLLEEGVKFNRTDLISEEPEEDVIAYAKQSKADMIAIVAVASRSKLNVIFSSHARPIINHSEVPVLAVTERDDMFSAPTM